MLGRFSEYPGILPYAQPPSGFAFLLAAKGHIILLGFHADHVSPLPQVHLQVQALIQASRAVVLKVWATA